MAAATPAIEMGMFRQFSFLSFHTALDAFMAVTKADPTGIIPISHDVTNNLVQVSEVDGNTVQEMLRAAGINVKGESVTLELGEVWDVDPKMFPEPDLFSINALRANP
ncbi:hypothetical protein [Microvirga calopogonii]|uniref:hypothetical protein n=1 Tax=Microvirga calopogonii TaxID=2078013 RepID=UPI000E0D3E98|nr:hypothetical protein [Microvirga calopogonii]